MCETDRLSITHPTNVWSKAAARLPSLQVPLLLFLLTVGVYWKVALTSQYTWLNSPDHVNQILPWMQEEATELRHGRLPVWDMHHWGGQSLIGQDQPGVLFPLNWLLWAMPLQNGHISLVAANWYFVLIHYFAALFGYFLARDLGQSRFAASFVAAAFGLSGFMGNVNWPQMLNGGMFLPLVLLFMFRALDGRRPLFSMAAAGALAGFAMWGGHHQLPTFTLLAVGFLLLFYVLFRELRLRTAALLGAVCLVFTVFAGAPQLLPSYEYWSRSLRWVGSKDAVGWHDKVPYVVFNLYSFSPAQLANFVLPGWQPIGTPFVGVAVLSLAIVAVCAARANRKVGPLAALGIAGLVYALGSFTVFHGALYAVLPMIDKSRSAGFAVFLVDLALAVLAGFGIDWLVARRHEAPAVVRVASAILLGAGTVTFALLFVRLLLQGDKALDYPVFGMLALSCAAMGAVFAASRIPAATPKALGTAVFAVMLFETGAVTGQLYPSRESGWDFVDQLSAHDDLAAFLRKQPGQFRIDKNSKDIAYNFGDWYGMDEVEGYAGVTANIHSVSWAPHARELLGLQYDLARSPRGSDAEEVFHGRSGVNVYRVPDAFPRAWAVHEARRIAAPQHRFDEFDVPREKLVSSTFLAGPAPALERCSGQDTVSVRQTSETEFAIQADMSCRGMVIVANTYFPGWKAQVDGKAAPVYEAYTFLDGVVVDSGHHQIRLWYQPVFLMAGCAMAALALLGLWVFARIDPPRPAYPHS